MITLRMNLLPYGVSLYQEDPLITAEFYTIPGKDSLHGFCIKDNTGDVLAEGAVPKTHSGHRNPLHLLRDALATVDFDSLGTDYITTSWDRKA
jgi:hypothetical protein